MLNSQRLSVRRSEISERLSVITQGELTPELRGEADTLAAELTDVEHRYQLAVKAESVAAEERQQAAMSVPTAPADKGLAELRSRASLLRYAEAAAENRSPTGAEEELRAELLPGSAPNRVPLIMLGDPGLAEERSVAGEQQPTDLDWRRALGIFRMKILSRLGVMPISVPSGSHLYTAFRNGATPVGDTATGTTAASDSALNAVSVSLPPTRLTAQVRFQTGQSHQTPMLEQEIRNLLAESISDRMEFDSLIGGTFSGATQTYTKTASIYNPLAAHASGSATDTVTLASVPAAQATFADMLGLGVDFVDGRYVSDQGGVSAIASLDAWRHAHKSVVSANSGEVTAGSQIEMKLANFIASDFIPGFASTGTTRDDVANLLLVRDAALREQMVIPVHDSMSLIRDDISDAASQGIRLTVACFWNSALVPIGSGGAALAAGNGAASWVSWKTTA